MEEQREIGGNPLVLGIETSCDETAAAVVDGDGRIHANVVFTQIEDHAPFGGVVPEIAARAHLDHLRPVIERALEEAGIGFEALDAVAATGGPGLIGGVLVGTMTAKAIAMARGIPYLAVNHLEAHALTARLTDHVPFPYLLLLVSGGHCQLIAVEGLGKYRRLGTTIDDAVGEAFDKTAKLLGMGYPGGPELEKAAEKGNPERFELPRPMVGKPGCDFSFSGLKTAVRQKVSALGEPTEQDIADIAAAFQHAVAASLVNRCRNAIQVFSEMHGAGHALVVAGGVAANKHLRAALSDLAGKSGMDFVAPPIGLCTDNAAMVAWAGIERLRAGERDPLSFAPRPRWPLDPGAPKAVGAGVKA
ncbi:tRNA (adenosine(37)-N6)-threonylcarbamoyltransferase complex transferase subunit TsaD [Nisaea sediminum]|uniref:tRNA (adenosine(37)-N6)-threonylcarbamoyltransferase complex transferase subunit TsaD n=1 Tax=Nisaea sediminum TaxID=2775867 RepID=UPI001D004F50|nr:tRNA (adenosine(37)-N6)-threonylcarbamoyltransferase complex transferase subunit TsaD [Nisaea sediminum]